MLKKRYGTKTVVIRCHGCHAKYIVGTGKSAYIIPSGIPRKQIRYDAHIFTEAELKAFFTSICGDESLDRLCGIILEAFDFIDEHLYEFCMDNRMYSEDAYQSAPEGDEPSTRIILDNIGLYKGQKFTLHYDFGDDWMFTITANFACELH